jgi:hypothetical protein
MMLQNHIIAAVVISRLVPNPIIGLSLAFGSHYLLDLMSYPSKEMEITLQSKRESARDKITFFFASSFFVLLSIMIVLLVWYKGELTLYTMIAMIVANIPDVVEQLIPSIKGTEKLTKYGHPFEIIKNPYLEFTFHQGLTLAGFVFILLH